jgi:hypothetical protein
MNYTKPMSKFNARFIYIRIVTMNCLNIDPNLFKAKIDHKLRDFNYSCLDLLTSYEIPIEIYYHYLLSIEEFKLKNVWNILVTQWTKMNSDLKDNKEFKTGSYNDTNINKIHENIDDDKMNNLLKEFIKDDILKVLFVCNIIQGCIVPK